MKPRKLAKAMAFACGWVVVSPLVLLAWLEEKISDKESVFVSLGQLLSLIPGKVGSFLRSAYYFGTLEACSWEVRIGFGSFFSHRSARLGSHVSMGSYCIIGTATIDSGVMMASRVSIPSGKRQHFDDNGYISSTPRFERVTIGNNTWIGEGVIVLADVGADSILSAGAVIVNRIPSQQLAAGNPAKPIRSLAQTASPADSSLSVAQQSY